MKKIKQLSVPVVLAVVAMLAGGFQSAPAAEDSVLSAMQTEIERTRAQLHLPDSPKPYFISCSLERSHFAYASAELGALTGSGETTNATLTVVVRVGDYQMDDSNFLPKPMWGGWSRLDLAVNTPIDGDTQVIRRAIWWNIDHAYKKAVENFKRKIAVLENRATPPVAADFAPAPALVFSSEETLQHLPPCESLAEHARALSRPLAMNRKLHTGAANISVSAGQRWHVNSEGAKCYLVENSALMTVSATSQSDDGVLVGDAIQCVARTYDCLPSLETQHAAVAAMGQRVEVMRKAPLLEDFAGPILFEDEAAAELCARVFPQALSSRREPIAEEEGMNGWFFDDKTRESLRRKIGRRVMSAGFHVTDDPTLKVYAGIPLAGHYQVDLEGVQSEKVSLVQNGILKTLLTTRTPDKKLSASNGHAVSMDFNMFDRVLTAGITSLIIRHETGMEQQALRERLIQAIQEQEAEYGLVVRRIPREDSLPARNQRRFRDTDNETVIMDPVFAFRIYPDGREEAVRIVALKGLDMPAFKDILAAGNKLHVYNYTGRERLNSIVCPSILFEEGVVIKPEKDIAKPPLLPSPMLADK